MEITIPGRNNQRRRRLLLAVPESSVHCGEQGLAQQLSLWQQKCVAESTSQQDMKQDWASPPSELLHREAVPPKKIYRVCREHHKLQRKLSKHKKPVVSILRSNHSSPGLLSSRFITVLLPKATYMATPIVPEGRCYKITGHLGDVGRSLTVSFQSYLCLVVFRVTAIPTMGTCPHAEQKHRVK